MTDRELFAVLDASRPGASCDDPSLDAAARAALDGADARQLHERIAAVDQQIIASLDSDEVPRGLAERILARLASASQTSGLGDHIAQAAAASLPVGRASAAETRQPSALAAPPSAKHPHRRLFLAGSIAALTAAVIVAIKLYPQPASPWTADQVLDAAISFYGRDVDRAAQRPMAEAPRNFPASRDLDRASVVAWRRPAEGFAESDVIAYDLASNAGGAAVRGVLYVFAPDRVADNLPDEAPRSPSTPTTQGVCAAVWRDRDLVYVLVVEGGPREYRQLLRDRGGPVALRDSPAMRLAAL